MYVLSTNNQPGQLQDQHESNGEDIQQNRKWKHIRKVRVPCCILVNVLVTNFPSWHKYLCSITLVPELNKKKLLKDSFETIRYPQVKVE